MSLATATLTATFQDPEGHAASGWVEIALDGPMSDPAGTHRTIEPVTLLYTLTGGGALPSGVVLYCTDNAGQQPAIQSYRMTKHLNGLEEPETVHFVMPSASSGGTVDLSTLVTYPAAVDPTVEWYLGRGSPAGVVNANIGSFYVNLNGGSPMVYIKTSGVFTTSGWQGLLAL